MSDCRCSGLRSILFLSCCFHVNSCTCVREIFNSILIRNSYPDEHDEYHKHVLSSLQLIRNQGKLKFGGYLAYTVYKIKSCLFTICNSLHYQQFNDCSYFRFISIKINNSRQRFMIFINKSKDVLYLCAILIVCALLALVSRNIFICNHGYMRKLKISI